MRSRKKNEDPLLLSNSSLLPEEELASIMGVGAGAAAAEVGVAAYRSHRERRKGFYFNIAIRQTRAKGRAECRRGGTDHIGVLDAGGGEGFRVRPSPFHRQ